MKTYTATYTHRKKSKTEKLEAENINSAIEKIKDKHGLKTRINLIY